MARQLTKDGKGSDGAHACFMLHHAASVRHPHHDLLEAFRLQDEVPVVMAESQVAGCLQCLALHIVSPTAYELLHTTSLGKYLLLSDCLAGEAMFILQDTLS